MARTTTIYVYIRGEYPACRTALETELAQAGNRLAHLDLVFVSGHGAHVCGEDMARIESIEGKRGMPRLKPPCPTVAGLCGPPWSSPWDMLRPQRTLPPPICYLPIV